MYKCREEDDLKKIDNLFKNAGMLFANAEEDQTSMQKESTAGKMIL
jgi:hypothetical protein